MTDKEQNYELMWKKEFSFRLKRRMQYLGLTPIELSKLSGVSIKSVRGYLDLLDPKIPNAIVVPKLAKALITTSSYLLDFDVK